MAKNRFSSFFTKASSKSNQTNQELKTLLKEFGKSLGSADQAINSIKSGDSVFIGTACATPKTLVNSLEKTPKPLNDVTLWSFGTIGGVCFEEEKPKTRFKHIVFFVGSDHEQLIKAGKAHYLPISMYVLPKLIDQGKLPVDVALIQVSWPDRYGNVSLGISVDVTLSAVKKAKIVIAEINRQMPFTHGETTIPLKSIDYLINVDSALTEYEHELPDDIALQIAQYVSRVIDDNATLHIGTGKIPNEMLKYLTNRRGLGIHTDVLTDAVVDLVEKGVVDGNSKGIHKGKSVASYCLGTKRLYEFIDQNPLFHFGPIDYVSDPAVILQNEKMVSVTQAWSIDLTGQVCSDQFKGSLYGGVATQADFHRSAAQTNGGKSIVCLRATTDDGNESRIRPHLFEGESVTIPRHDVHYVITEYGYAYLFCKSIEERALSLIEIAHPNFRPWLLREATKLGLITHEVSLKSKSFYPEAQEHEAGLKDGTGVLIRPAKASDVHGIQDLFYHLRPEDVFTRFFTKLTALPVPKAQHLCNVDYENEMAFLAVSGEREFETVVGTSCYFLDPADNLAEVAYMIHPDFQGKGLGTILHNRTAQYAKDKGANGLKGSVLGKNKKMINVLEKIGDVEYVRDVDVLEFTVKF